MTVDATFRSSIVLRERPQRASSDVSSCFERVDEPAAPAPSALPPGHVSGSIRYIGFEPAMRNWLEPSSRSYLPAVKLGETMRSRAVGVVTQSTCPHYQPGDLVEGLLGWSTHFSLPASQVRKRRRLDGDGDERHLIGLLSSTGMAAYVATCVLLQLGKGDVVLVTGAGGSVGGLAAQIAAAQGARVIATTTRATAKGQLAGKAHVIDWSNEEDRAVAQALFRSYGGLSAVVDNVGGEVLDEALLGLRSKAKVILCGSSSTYGGQATPLKNLFRVLETSATLQGFNVDDYENHVDDAAQHFSSWLRSGQLQITYSVTRGLDSCPAALTRLLQRQTVGKPIVSLVDDNGEQGQEQMAWQDMTVVTERRSLCLQVYEPAAYTQTLVFVNGTGFPRELWKPLARRIQARQAQTKFVIFDMSLQGYSGALNEGLELPFSVDLFAQDIAAVLEYVADPQAIIVAHSIGGAAALLTAQSSPLAGLIVIDPPLEPFARTDQPAWVSRMKALTQRRRAQWPTREEAESHFRNTGFLRGWNKEVADLYLAHALRDDNDADGGCSLRTPSRVEMETYSVPSQVFHDVFQGLPRISCPVGLVSCAFSDNFPPSTLNLAASKLQTSLVYSVDAHHLMPMTHLETMDDIVQAFTLQTSLKQQQ